MSLASIWFILGLLLTVAEIAIPGFIVIFFGVGAFVTAAVAQFTDASLLMQGYVFTVASVLALVVGRRCFRATLHGKRGATVADADDDGFVGAVVEVTEAIEPPRAGRVSLHGAEWAAVAERPIAKGETVTVVARQNITLTVR